MQLYHCHGYRNHEINALIKLPDCQWCAFEIKFGTHRIDDADKNLLVIRRQIAEDLKGKSLLCVLCGMANTAY